MFKRKKDWCWSVTLTLIAAAAAGCGSDSQITAQPPGWEEVPGDWDFRIAAYPQGEVHDAILLLRKSGPKQVRAGQEFEYWLELYNPTDQVVLKNVVVRDYAGPNVRVTSSTPNWYDIDEPEERREPVRDPREGDEDLDDFSQSPPRTRTDVQPDEGGFVPAPAIRWFIEDIYPEKMVTIRVRARAMGEGNIMNCATATYEIAACIESAVVQPELRLTAVLPGEFIICDEDETQLTLRVANTGTGDVNNVVVTAELPDGLTVDGARRVSENVGTLKGGQSREIKKTVQVGASGEYVIRATARAAELTTQANPVNFIARRGRLAIEADGPSLEYVGVPIEYEIRVGNVGTARARDLVVEAPVPAGMEFVDASNDGKVEGGKVIWRFAELPEGYMQPVNVRFRASDTPGTARIVARARAYCSGEVTDIVRTQLEGVAAMVVECVDEQDPVKLGQTTTYEIKVTNQGSADETNVILTCELEDAQEFVSATGATETGSRAGSRRVTFAPVPTLAPKATATWKVVVRALEEGDIRFRIQVDSDQHGRPVNESEATKQYVGQ